MATYLLIDASFLAHRAFHSTGSLEYEGIKTGVIFGFLRDLETQVERHGATTVVFAFDSGGLGHRGLLCPTYKAKRREMTDAEKEARIVLHSQVDALRSVYLPKMGYKNCLKEKGFEADDILAAVAQGIRGEDEAVIVTADNDLWQCISSNVRWHSPSTARTVTFQSFKEEWGIDPVQWASVKALAGCMGDGVEGIRGVGEKTAAKWLRGKLPATNKRCMDIEANLDVHHRNFPLVRLPFDGLPPQRIVEDEVTEAKRIAVQLELGIRNRRVPNKPFPTWTPIGFFD